MREKLTNYIRAGYPGICLVTAEETRAEAELKAVAVATKHGLVAWSATTGLTDTGDGRALGAEDPMEAVTAVAGLPDNTVVLLRDFHMFLADANPVLIRALKDALAHAKTAGKCVVIAGCRGTLPPELELVLSGLRGRVSVVGSGGDYEGSAEATESVAPVEKRPV